jgi:hypothetical protein
MFEQPQQPLLATIQRSPHPPKTLRTVSGRKTSKRRLRAKRANEGDFSQINEVSSRLVRLDALAFFADNCELALAGWLSILGKTTLPGSITSSDHHVAAFKELDSIIFGVETTTMLKRFAYIRLAQVFETLEEILRFDHWNGKIEFKSGFGAASFAVDIYASAQERPTTKKQLAERTRYARRLRDLAAHPPFSLLIYSGAAEHVACVPYRY